MMSFQKNLTPRDYLKHREKGAVKNERERERVSDVFRNYTILYSSEYQIQFKRRMDSRVVLF